MLRNKSIINPPVDKMIRSTDAKNKSMTKVKIKILRPFQYNGKFVNEGDEIEMNEERAVNHMRVGDVERDEQLIKKIKEQRQAAAEAAIVDAQANW
jgi:hypothetical protein